MVIAEVPIPWRDIDGSKIRFGRDAASMLLGLARVRHRVNRRAQEAAAGTAEPIAAG